MAKRGNGAGSVYRRKSDGKWVGSITPDNGKRKVFYGKTQKEVQDKVNDALYAQQLGMLPADVSTTMDEYMRHWLEDIHKPLVKLSTYKNYQELLENDIIPGLGKLKLQSLTPQHVQAFYSRKLNHGLAPKTVSNIHGVLHKALDNAVKWNILSRNVCDAVSPPRVARKEKTVLSADQARTLLKQMEQHRLRALFTLAIVTGMREGELLALRWHDIDISGCSLQVKRSVRHIKGYGYVESEPKTVKSRRKIMLPRFVVEVLLLHKKQQEDQRRANAEIWVERGLVFASTSGNYIALSTLRRALNGMLKQAGLPHMRFHDLRHSAATILLSRGTHPKVVQEILGHSHISMTLDVYSHVLPAMQEDVTRRWDDDFGAAVPIPVK